MSEKSGERWRTWPREGPYIIAPDDATTEERWAAMWMLSCEEYGIDPYNPPPLRRDVVRKSFREPRLIGGLDEDRSAT